MPADPTERRVSLHSNQLPQRCFPAFNKIGGYPNLEEAYLKAVPSKIVPNTTCHLPRADAMHLFRDPVSGDLPWTGMTFGLSIMATWYWCTDQVNVNKNPLPQGTRRRLGSTSSARPLSPAPTGPSGRWSQGAAFWSPQKNPGPLRPCS